MLDIQLTGKVAIITGCNNPHGIGAATARAFAAQGVALVLHYYRSPWSGEIPQGFGDDYYYAMQAKTAEHVVEEIHSNGGRAVASEGDLSDPNLVPQLFDLAESEFGPVQILINNAAHSVPDTFLPGVTTESGERGAGGLGLLQETLTPASIDRHFAVNTRATALMMAEFGKRHLARGDDWGRIINISTDGAPAFAGEVSYGSSKFAIEAYSRAAAKEFGPHGITVNIASPGPIQTGWMNAELVETVSKTTPMGRPGTPEDMADGILLFASHQARWVTGQILHIGGGHRMV